LATATRTVVFTDLVNYTEKTGNIDREGLRRLLDEHRRLVEPILLKRGGRVVKELGDAFMALFDSATDAAQAGRDIIEKVASANTFQIRVSAATGDVEEIANDAFGDAVNLASRINSATGPGECWFSESTRICMNQSEIPWEPVREVTLKGIHGPVMCYRVVGKHKAWLPNQVRDAFKSSNLLRVRRNEPLGAMPADPVILFENFAPGSVELKRAVDSIPVLDPSRLWLSAYHIGPADRLEWTSNGHGLVIGHPASVDRAFDEVRAETSHKIDRDTIIIDKSDTEVDLVLSGLALPAVPMADVVAGYTYDLLSDRRWVNRSDQAVLRVEVSQPGVKVLAIAAGVSVDGRPLAPGQSLPLANGASLSGPGGSHRFVLLHDAPYIGLFINDSPIPMGVAVGQVTEIGREPQIPGFLLPDRRGQENIRWCPGPRAARAREGGFTLDRALAGRRQSAVEVERGGHYRLRSLHPRCPTFIFSDHRPLERVDTEATLHLGDLVIAGTTLVGLRGPQGED